MRIIGIDPGFDRLGIAVIEGNPSKPTLVWSICVEPKKGNIEYRLSEVYDAIRLALQTYQPHALAIETLFFSTNRKTAIGVAEARGAILAAAGAQGVLVIEFSPQQVKLAVTGYGASDKAAISKMIPRLISLSKKKYLDDELDAIAVALAGLSSNPQHPQKILA
jgi:crossover junction endodeoxyribonuclease RuvC